MFTGIGAGRLPVFFLYSDLYRLPLIVFSIPCPISLPHYTYMPCLFPCHAFCFSFCFFLFFSRKIPMYLWLRDARKTASVLSACSSLDAPLFTITTFGMLLARSFMLPHSRSVMLCFDACYDVFPAVSQGIFYHMPSLPLYMPFALRPASLLHQIAHDHLLGTTA